MKLRSLFIATALVAVVVASIAHVRFTVLQKRSLVHQLESRGFGASFTERPGMFFEHELTQSFGKSWVNRIHYSDAEDVEHYLDLYGSSYLCVKMRNTSIGNADLESLSKISDINVDLDIYDCNCLETLRFPKTIQSCVFEESHDHEDVIRLLDGLADTDVRFLALTLHWSEPPSELLAAKLKRLRNLEVFDLTYGKTFFNQEVDGQLTNFPKLRFAFTSDSLREAMKSKPN